MSQVYATEPQTSGLVVLETTAGPLSIHLWCKECPHTVRYFLQLCIDGFYDNLVFHRVVPNFLIQTGDANFRQSVNSSSNSNNSNSNSSNSNSNSGDGANDKDKQNPWSQPPPNKYREQHRAAEALDRRQYELNSRIRFNHRGQIAMALGIDDNNNGDGSLVAARLQPQFFVTLDEASHLDGKHVCFGGITGPTIFNALRIGQSDIYNNENDENDTRNFQPRIVSEAPRILRTKILQIDLPFTLPALAPTQNNSLLPWKFDPSTAAATSAGRNAKHKRKKKNRKGVKNTNLLSFGEEMNEYGGGGGGDDDNPVAKKKKKNIQSSHDVLTSKSLSTKKSMPSEPSSSIETKNETQAQAQAQAKQQDAPPIDDDRRQCHQEKTDATTTTNTNETSKPHTNSHSLQPTFYSRADRKTAEGEGTSYNNGNVNVNVNVNDNDTTTVSSQSNGDKKDKKNKVRKISLVEARRAKYAKKKGSNKQQREDKTMALFKAFQQKITTTSGSGSKQGSNDNGNGNGNEDPNATTYHGQILENDDDVDVTTGKSKINDWMRTKFKCKKHIDQDAKNMVGADGRGIDDYVVIKERGSATDRKPGKRKRHRHG